MVKDLAYNVRPPVPSGPRAFLLRSILAGGHDYLALAEDIAADHGDVASFRIGGRRIWCVFHPDDVEALLVGDHRHLVKDLATQSLAEVLGQGLITSEGELWRRQRRRIAPEFTPRRIQEHAEAMVRTAAQHRDDPARFPAPDAEAPVELEVHRRFSDLTLEIVVKTLFGSHRAPPYTRIGAVLDELTEAYGRRLGSWEQLLPMSIPIASSRAIQRCRRALDEIVADMMAQHEKGDGGALLDRLLGEVDDEGKHMPTELVRDELTTLLLAGHETTALVLTYAAYLLAGHPEIQTQLHREVDQALGGREATIDDLRALRLTDAIVRESMRLYPPAWSIGREVISPVRVRGYTIPPGDQILLAAWINHRDPRWFPEPLAFRPQRWLEADPARPRFAYFPFGGGPRICVGNHFAMLEGVLALATLAQGLAFHRVERTQLELSPAVTLRPMGGGHPGCRETSPSIPARPQRGGRVSPKATISGTFLGSLPRCF